MAIRLPFPVNALDQHTLLLGKTRSGKSSKMRLIVEHFLDRTVPVTIIDPKGDWWGLKSSASGKEAGYPIIIFGSEWAKFKDVQINKHSGAEIGKLVATGNRSCIIDLKGMTVGDRTQFFIDFADAYFRHAEGKRVLAIDEVHNFAPQGKVIDPKAGMALHWANRLIAEGAGMGITMLSASQRPQKVHKDYATSHETLIACRAVHKLDRDASGDWVDACGDPGVKKDLVGSLAGMKRDEAWVYSPEIDFGPKQISFPLFSTYDSFAPQEAKTSRKLKGWASVNLSEVEEKIAALVEENKANDPKELKAEIARLRAEAARQPARTAPVSAVDPAVVASAYQRGVGDAFRTIKPLLAQSLKNLSSEISAKFATVNLNFPEIETPKNLTKGAAVAAASPEPARARSVPAPVAGLSVTPKRQSSPVGASGDGAKLPKAERRILTALAQYPQGRTKQQVAILSGYAVTGGGFNNALGKLRSLQYIEDRPGILVATQAGLDALGPFDPLPHGDALLQHWLGQLPKAERAALTAIAAAYPQPISKEQAAADAGYEPTGGGFNNALGKLRSLELISGRGDLIASEALFG